MRFDDQLPGTTWKAAPDDGSIRVQGVIQSRQPLSRIEVIKNGEVVQTLDVASQPTAEQAFSCRVDTQVAVDASCWLALRCFEQPGAAAPAGKVIFAHTNPVFVDIAERPLKPRRREVQFFVERMQQELTRNQGVLSDEALAEYAEAKAIYEAILEKAQ